jgi:two-component sensor histidine kinase
MISATLMHKVLNRLQTISGFIELAEVTPEGEKRKDLFARARQEISDLVSLLKAHRPEKKT